KMLCTPNPACEFEWVDLYQCRNYIGTSISAVIERIQTEFTPRYDLPHLYPLLTTPKGECERLYEDLLWKDGQTVMREGGEMFGKEVDEWIWSSGKEWEEAD